MKTKFTIIHTNNIKPEVRAGLAIGPMWPKRAAAYPRDHHFFFGHQRHASIGVSHRNPPKIGEVEAIPRETDQPYHFGFSHETWSLGSIPIPAQKRRPGGPESFQVLERGGNNMETILFLPESPGEDYEPQEISVLAGSAAIVIGESDYGGPLKDVPLGKEPTTFSGAVISYQHGTIFMLKTSYNAFVVRVTDKVDVIFVQDYLMASFALRWKDNDHLSSTQLRPAMTCYTTTSEKPVLGISTGKRTLESAGGLVIGQIADYPDLLSLVEKPGETDVTCASFHESEDGTILIPAKEAVSDSILVSFKITAMSLAPGAEFEILGEPEFLYGKAEGRNAKCLVVLKPGDGLRWTQNSFKPVELVNSGGKLEAFEPAKKKPKKPPVAELASASEPSGGGFSLEKAFN